MKNKTLAIQLVLFVVTVITTTLAGAEAMTGRFFFFLPEKDILKFPQDFWQGFEFSIPFLAILTCHEFGHFLWQGITKSVRHYLITYRCG
jgi:hypothetical protein